MNVLRPVPLASVMAKPDVLLNTWPVGVDFVPRALPAGGGFVTTSDATKLRDAWIFASRVRSAMVLWMTRTTDVLPTDRQQLDGVARLLEYPPGSATQLEEDYLRLTRLARAVFEKRFYGVEKVPGPTTG